MFGEDYASVIKDTIKKFGCTDYFYVFKYNFFIVIFYKELEIDVLFFSVFMYKMVYGE